MEVFNTQNKMSFYKTGTTQFNYPFCQIAKDSREARSFLPADCVIQTGNRTRFVSDVLDQDFPKSARILLGSCCLAVRTWEGRSGEREMWQDSASSMASRLRARAPLTNCSLCSDFCVGRRRMAGASKRESISEVWVRRARARLPQLPRSLLEIRAGGWRLNPPHAQNPLPPLTARFVMQVFFGGPGGAASFVINAVIQLHYVCIDSPRRAKNRTAFGLQVRGLPPTRRSFAGSLLCLVIPSSCHLTVSGGNTQLWMHVAIFRCW